MFFASFLSLKAAVPYFPLNTTPHFISTFRTKDTAQEVQVLKAQHGDAECCCTKQTLTWSEEKINTVHELGKKKERETLGFLLNPQVKECGTCRIL